MKKRELTVEESEDWSRMDGDGDRKKRKVYTKKRDSKEQRSKQRIGELNSQLKQLFQQLKANRDEKEIAIKVSLTYFSLNLGHTTYAASILKKFGGFYSPMNCRWHLPIFNHNLVIAELSDLVPPLIISPLEPRDLQGAVLIPSLKSRVVKKKRRLYDNSYVKLTSELEDRVLKLRTLKTENSDLKANNTRLIDLRNKTNKKLDKLKRQVDFLKNENETLKQKQTNPYLQTQIQNMEILQTILKDRSNRNFKLTEALNAKNSNLETWEFQPYIVKDEYKLLAKRISLHCFLKFKMINILLGSWPLCDYQVIY